MTIIGFIGLGIMGRPMAKNLLGKGYRLIVHDLRPEPVHELVAAGAGTETTPAAVAARSDVIITMLPNSPEVKDVVFGRDGLVLGLKPGTVFVDMSSIAPLASREISGRLADLGVVMLDAPVSGGEPKAVDGSLAIMVGGPENAFEKVKDILLAMGTSVTRIGDIGCGNLAKLANQMIVAVNIAAVSEALVLVTKAGANPETVAQAIRGGLAGSAVLQAKVPMMLARNFKPGFRIELHIKDLANALETAHETGVPVPLTSQIMEVMQALKADGKAGQDHSGLVQFFEKLAGVDVKS